MHCSMALHSYLSNEDESEQLQGWTMLEQNKETAVWCINWNWVPLLKTRLQL